MTAGRPAAPDLFRVHFVCTANRCRSPIAEYLLRDAIAKRWGDPDSSRWVISSSGVSTDGGRSMDLRALEVLAERGVDGSDFSSRRLTPVVARDADLVLAATREHRGQIASLQPAALGRMFTMNQFGYLLSAAPQAVDTDPVTAGFDLIDRAKAARSQLPARTGEDDLADPVGRTIKDFRRCADILQADIQSILSKLP